MGILTHIETITAPFLPYGSDIWDLTFSLEPAGGDITVLAGTEANARFVKIDTDGSGNILSQEFMGYTPGDFAELEFDTRSLEISEWRLDAQLSSTQWGQVSGAVLSDLNNGFFGESVQAVWAETGGNSWLVTSHPDAPGLVSFGWDGSDNYTATDTSTGLTNTTYSDLESVTAFGKTWIIGPSADDDVVSVYSLTSGGSLEFHARSGTANGLWIGTPVAQTIVTIDGQPFVLVASYESSSLSVLRLQSDGTLIPVDHVIDNLTTRFDGASHIETTVVNGTAFAVISGGDDGFSLFQIRQDGHVIYHASQEDAVDTTLENISALSIGYDVDGLHIYAASGVEIGLTHFSYDPGNIGLSITGSPAADTLTSNNDNDVITGGAGDDILNGSGGADFLMDGAGSDTLTGGDGADRFSFEYDGETDTITDFEAGIDALDLSYYPLLYTTDDLTFSSTVSGARVTFNAEIIEIFSDDGLPLSLDDVFGISAFDLTRPTLISGGGEPEPSAITILGSTSDDLLIGTPADDYFSGEMGDDILIGAAGADTFYGGSGFDTVDYSTASNAIILDIMTPASNSGDATGDTYFSIESITGTGFDDIIYGSDFADQIIGSGGGDTLDGRGGNDALEGGAGNDTLSGGERGDVLDGGTGTDLASYSGATAGVRLDLNNQLANSGDAAGDRFISIENVLGTGWGDTVFGTGAANTFWGDDGADWLSGDRGNDMLDGGAQNDILSGGAGADTLIGGAGQDTSSYITAKSGLTINLDDTSGNTGEAGGDIFVSIENVIGSRFDDDIAGNLNANTLHGAAGNDLLSGQEGDDYLSGGHGDDRLNGGIGTDILRGGVGGDVFVFVDGFGDDTILDLNAEVDQIEIDATVFSNLPSSGDELVSTYANVVDNNVVFDFDNGNSITIEGVTDVTGLADIFAIV